MPPRKPKTTPTHHRLRSLAVTGGYLDGLRIDFADGLNCLIGARGSGKTTLLEFIRYALDAFGGDGRDRKRVEALVDANLGNGSIELGITTRDGLDYQIVRTSGEPPIVRLPSGEPAGVAIRGERLFRVEIFSQNDVETIAADPAVQQAIMDGFVLEERQAVDAAIQDVERSLADNGRRLTELRQSLSELSENIADLPGLEVQLAALRSAVGGDESTVNQAHVRKALRGQEMQAIAATEQALLQQRERLDELVGGLGRRIRAAFTPQLTTGPNGADLRAIVGNLEACSAEVDRALAEARQRLDQGLQQLAKQRDALRKVHDTQEIEFRKVVEQQQAAEVESARRVRLEAERTRLMARQEDAAEREEQLRKLEAERQTLLVRLSELRDQRYQIRDRAAREVSGKVGPHVRVRVRQCGNRAVYRALLENLLAESGVNRAQVSEKLATHFAPVELARAVVRENGQAELTSQANLNAVQAKKVVAALDRPEALLQLDSVSLDDLVQIELKEPDGEYREASKLSTGQKCTAMLPILILDSESPLLVDQPEDNLDNGYIYETVVEQIREVKKTRQLIFVTHNPNIPVLGEAEQVVVLAAEGPHGKIRARGNVDDCCDDIINLLEGGKDAFMKRKARYHF